MSRVDEIRAALIDCACGCGEKIPSRNKRGIPVKYAYHHYQRSNKPKYLEEERGFTSPCWIWQLSISWRGYGVTSSPGQKTVQAHRKMFEAAHGPIPAGMQIDHLCRIRSCVNPAHLEAVTPKENSRRGLKTKLGKVLADEVVARYRSGESSKALAAEYGIRYEYVSQLSREGIWND